MDVGGFILGTQGVTAANREETEGGNAQRGNITKLKLFQPLSQQKGKTDSEDGRFSRWTEGVFMALIEAPVAVVRYNLITDNS